MPYKYNEQGIQPLFWALQSRDNMKDAATVTDRPEYYTSKVGNPVSVT